MQSSLKMSTETQFTCILQEYLVLWPEDLHIQFALWSIVPDGPGTHDGVLVLGRMGDNYYVALDYL